MADDEARARRTTKAAGPAKKATPRKAATPPAAKAAAKKAAPAAKKAAPAKRTAAAPPQKAAPAARNRGAVLAPRPKKAPAFRVAAEETMEDDWAPPAPEPAREDPHARIRAVLRDAARQVEGRAPAPTAPRPTPAPPVPAARPAPPPEPEEVTRVLVAPDPPEEDEWLPDEEVEDEAHVEAEADEDWETEPEADDEEDWSPPEILEEEGGMRTIVSAPASRLSSIAPLSTPPQAPRTEAPPPPPPPPSPATDFTPPPFEARPAPATRGGRSRLKTLLVVLLGLVVVAAVVAGGIWAYKTFVDEGIDYSELKVGDCFNSSASNEIRGIKVKPCAEKHNSEIFFIVNHPAGPSDPYPGKDTLVQYAADNCLGQPLTEYLGVTLEQSKLKDFEIVPQESAWKDGRRALVCGLDTGGEGDITGSVKGTRR